MQVCRPQPIWSGRARCAWHQNEKNKNIKKEKVEPTNLRVRISDYDQVYLQVGTLASSRRKSRSLKLTRYFRLLTVTILNQEHPSYLCACLLTLSFPTRQFGPMILEMCSFWWKYPTRVKFRYYWYLVLAQVSLKYRQPFVNMHRSRSSHVSFAAWY